MTTTAVPDHDSGATQDASLPRPPSDDAEPSTDATVGAKQDAAMSQDASDATVADASGDATVDASATSPGMIGVSGGSATSSDGNVTIQIPAGALSGDVQVTITTTTNAPPGALGDVYDIEPSGTTFAKPVTLVFKNDRHYAAWASVGTVVNGAWQALPVSVVDAQTLRALTTHLSYYGIVPPITCADSSNCQAPFQCVSNQCLIPCENTGQCPSPLACRGGSCHSVACTADSDCTTALTQTSGRPGYSVVCGEVSHVCVGIDRSILPGMPCPEGPVTQGACPAGQVDTCGTCTFQSCPCGTGAECAEGFCWPQGTGCTCGQSGCPCGGAITGAACTPGAPVPDKGPGVSIAGDWYGLWQVGPYVNQFWIRVNQSGNALTGYGNNGVPGFPTSCAFVNATGTGTISGDQFSSTYSQPNGNYGTGCGFVSGGTMNGTFSSVQADPLVCGQPATGQFKMTKWDYSGPIP